MKPCPWRMERREGLDTRSGVKRHAVSGGEFLLDFPEAEPVKPILCRLLDRLDAIAERHDEVGDTDVREAMSAAVLDGFLRPVPDLHVLCPLGTRCSAREATGL